jgi:hypothetical protein
MEMAAVGQEERGGYVAAFPHAMVSRCRFIHTVSLPSRVGSMAVVSA